MKAVIFAGGVGTRLWPLSRKNNPKQFMSIMQDHTMIQLSYDRLKPILDDKDIYISTGEVYINDIKKQLPNIPTENIIMEPAMRDLGPAVGLAAALLEQQFPDEPTVFIWGADHIYSNEDKYRSLILAGGRLLSKDKDKMILIGEKPRFASENLGWIAYGDEVMRDNEIPFYSLNGFHYRPDTKTAQKYFSDGHHAWNMGDFLSTPRFLFNLFRQFAPELYSRLVTIQKSNNSSDFHKVLKREYPLMDKISMDNAVTELMDHANALVITDETGWADIGAWEALKEALEKSKSDNVTQGEIFLEDCQDNLIYNYDNNKLVVGIDLNDFLVVNTNDVLLITKKTSIPKVKSVVKKLEGTKYEDLT